MGRRDVLTSLVLSVFVLLSAFVLLSLRSEQELLARQPQGSKTVVRKQTTLTGHVVARVEHLTGYSMNLLGGLLYDVFIFGADNGEKQEIPAVPVKVVYEFYRYEPNLPEKFFDYSRVYELSVYRDARCDETVKSLSYETDVERGKPPRPRNILRVLSGAPTNVLKPDLELACYFLRQGQYKELSNPKAP